MVSVDVCPDLAVADLAGVADRVLCDSGDICGVDVLCCHRSTKCQNVRELGSVCCHTASQPRVDSVRGAVNKRAQGFTSDPIGNSTGKYVHIFCVFCLSYGVSFA